LNYHAQSEGHRHAQNMMGRALWTCFLGLLFFNLLYQWTHWYEISCNLFFMLILPPM